MKMEVNKVLRQMKHPVKEKIINQMLRNERAILKGISERIKGDMIVYKYACYLLSKNT